jgi:hypothetical protein
MESSLHSRRGSDKDSNPQQQAHQQSIEAAEADYLHIAAHRFFM